MRRLGPLEALLVFGLIVAYIWKMRSSLPSSWIIISLVMVASHWVRHESPGALGFEIHNWRNGLSQLAPVVLVAALVLVGSGAVFHTFREISWRDVVLSLAAYLPWGLVQQYALNGYFLNRFHAAFSTRVSSLLATLLFSAAHAPNLFLMFITVPLALYATGFYLRTRNLYLLGIAHALVGLMLFLVVPDSISHHLRVGPGWFRTDSP